MRDRDRCLRFRECEARSLHRDTIRYTIFRPDITRTRRKVYFIIIVVHHDSQYQPSYWGTDIFFFSVAYTK